MHSLTLWTGRTVATTPALVVVGLAAHVGNEPKRRHLGGGTDCIPRGMSRSVPSLKVKEKQVSLPDFTLDRSLEPRFPT